MTHSTRSLLSSLTLALALVGCGGGADLTVAVITDFALADEARTLRVELAAGADGLRRRSLSLAASDGVPAVTFDSLADGTYRADVALLGPGGDVLAARPVIIDVSGATVATVVLTRGCSEMSCGDEMACHGGACVDPRCSLESPGACGAAECSTASDCGALASCAAPSCEAGVCLSYGDASSCGADAYCDPTGGCVASTRPTCPAQLPPLVETDLVIEAGCTVQVPEDTQVVGGATLTVEGGGRLELGTGVRLLIGVDAPGVCGDDCAGGLVVAGTPEQPAVITSGAAVPAPGDWGAIVVGEQPVGVVTFDEALVEYAGRYARGNLGALFIEEITSRAPGRVAVANTTFQHNAWGAIEATAGINQAVPGVFERFERNTLIDNGEHSVRLSGNTMVELDAASIIEDPLLVVAGSAIGASGSWKAFDVPYVFENDLRVGSGVMLTIERGATLLFRAGRGMDINSASVVADGVTFGSASPMPVPGEWHGIDVAGQLTLTGCRVENATTAGNGAVVNIHRNAVVTITGTTFTGSVADVVISAPEPEDCAAFSVADPPNTFDLPVACEG